MYTPCSSNRGVFLFRKDALRVKTVQESFSECFGNWKQYAAADLKFWRAFGHRERLPIYREGVFVDQDRSVKNSLRGLLLAGCGVRAELYTAVRGLFAAKGDAKNG